MESLNSNQKFITVTILEKAAKKEHQQAANTLRYSNKSKREEDKKYWLDMSNERSKKAHAIEEIIEIIANS